MEGARLMLLRSVMVMDVTIVQFSLLCSRPLFLASFYIMMTSSYKNGGRNSGRLCETRCSECC